MSATIHVELPCSCDANDLLEFLAGRGLAGTVTRVDDHCVVDVRYAADPDERLCSVVEGGIEHWLAAHDRPLIPTRSGVRDLVLRPPGD